MAKLARDIKLMSRDQLAKSRDRHEVGIYTARSSGTIFRKHNSSARHLPEYMYVKIKSK